VDQFKSVEMLDSIGREQRAARQASTALEFSFVESQEHMVMHRHGVSFSSFILGTQRSRNLLQRQRRYNQPHQAVTGMEYRQGANTR
jgi:hypothetical protein